MGVGGGIPVRRELVLERVGCYASARMQRYSQVQPGPW
jgi:hypothetical protein